VLTVSIVLGLNDTLPRTAGCDDRQTACPGAQCVSMEQIGGIGLKSVRGSSILLGRARAHLAWLSADRDVKAKFLLLRDGELCVHKVLSMP
jgi:hypothetical protein